MITAAHVQARAMPRTFGIAKRTVKVQLKLVHPLSGRVDMHSIPHRLLYNDDKNSDSHASNNSTRGSAPRCDLHQRRHIHSAPPSCGGEDAGSRTGVGTEVTSAGVAASPDGSRGKYVIYKGPEGSGMLHSMSSDDGLVRITSKTSHRVQGFRAIALGHAAASLLQTIFVRTHCCTRQWHATHPD